MASVGGVGSEVAARVESSRRPRWVRLTGTALVVALFAGFVAWQIAARTSEVEPGSSSNSGAGATLPDCVPSDDDIWSMFGNDEDVVVLQTVRNPSPWPVTVISTNPEAYRFEPVADDFREDYMYVGDPVDGPPDAAETSDRVVIPPDREAAMWIINPQGDLSYDGGWGLFEGAPVKLRALGVERDFYLPFRATLAVGGDEATAGRLDRALQAACGS
jgi:hypothetical protein